MIDRSLPTVNHLRGMTGESSLTHRSLTFALSAQQDERRAGDLKVADQALAKGEAPLRDVAPVLEAELGAGAVARLKKANDLYRTQRAALVALLRAGQRQEAAERVHEMRDALDAFMTTVADVADAFSRRSQDKSDLVSANVRTRGTIVLGLGGWPLAIAAALTLLIAVVLILMFNLARNLSAPGDRESDRLPGG